MKTIFILVGLPASGKSTWARTVCDTNKNIRVVSKDVIRSLFSGNYERKYESLVISLRNQLISTFLNDGHDVIVDDTNLNPIHIHQITKKFESETVQIKIVDHFLQVPVEECIERDSNRNPEKRVGKDVILEMYNKWIVPNKVVTKQDINSNKAKAIIVDLDGTLAQLNGRNPYDASTCFSDDVHPEVKFIIDTYHASGFKIIFCSGRTDNYKEQTLQFLTKKCNFSEKEFILLMRKHGDTRKDHIVKQELYFENIDPFYNVKLVLDDRNSVVDMWRQLGLICFQVAPGNF